MEIKKAVKSRQRLRLVIDGVSGSGKTYSALAVASGMGEKIGLIDTEHGSASLYGDRFDFDTIELEQFQIEDYTAAIDMTARAGYDILIIDSASHGWDALLERVDQIANYKYKSNSFRAWGEGTPLQRRLIEKILSYPGHVIATCRSKTEYAIGKNEKDKTVITKVGAAPVQRQGFEYEFTTAMTMDRNHVGMVAKDRTGKYQDRFIKEPGAELGQELTAWLNQGAERKPEGPREQADVILYEIAKVLNRVDSDGRFYFTQEEIEEERKFVRRLGINEERFNEEGVTRLEERITLLKDRLALRMEDEDEDEFDRVHQTA